MPDSSAPVVLSEPDRRASATPRVAAYALCIREDDAILLVRVAPGYPAAGSWTLPGGGLHFGEDPAVGVLRELTEETGLEGEVRSLAFVQSSAGVNPAGDAWHGIRIVYRVTISGGELRPEVDESTDMAAWVGPQEAAALPLDDLAREAIERGRSA